MKILYVTNIPNPYRQDFFEELAKYCDLTVIYERLSASDRDISWAQIRTKGYDAKVLKSFKYGKEKSLSIDIFKYLKDDYDEIVLCGYSSVTMKLLIINMKLRGKKFILNVDGGFAKNENCIKRFIKKFLIKSAYKYLATGKEAQNYLCYYGANKKDVFNVPLSSIRNDQILAKCVEVCVKNEIKAKYNINAKNVVIFVGQFIHRKGVDILVKASKLVRTRNVEFILIGGDAQKLNKIFLEAPIPNNIRCIDFVTPDKVRELMVASDVFVLPTREDIWGLVIIEALAVGLPIITTDKCIAGLELINDKENGFIIPSDDPTICALRIDEILCNKKLRENIFYNNTNKALNLTIEKNAISTFEFLRTSIDVKEASSSLE